VTAVQAWGGPDRFARRVTGPWTVLAVFDRAGHPLTEANEAMALALAAYRSGAGVRRPGRRMLRARAQREQEGRGRERP
jgi:hypothetical protein